MDAIFRGILLFCALTSVGAGFRTPNFVVHANSAEFAKQVGEAAEIYRRELAIEWTGKPLQGNWQSPCPIHVTVGTMGAGGATTFNFQNGEVYGWKMNIQGSEERILDSVLPHEVNHTIFATVFRRPLPRWADEGAASLIEHDSERHRLREIHTRAMSNRRKIPLKTLLDIKNYPQDKQDVLTLYAEGHSLADYLIQHGDKPKYLSFLAMAHEKGWPAAFKNIYGIQSIDALEKEWDQWVIAGSVKLDIPEGSQVADRGRPQSKPDTVRGQSPADLPALGAATDLRQAVDSSSANTRSIASNMPTRSKRNLREPILVISELTSNAAKPTQPAELTSRGME